MKSRIPRESKQSISPMRKAIGEKIQASKTFIPHFYIQQDVDVELMINLREQLKVDGIKVTYNDFIHARCSARP